MAIHVCISVCMCVWLLYGAQEPWQHGSLEPVCCIYTLWYNGTLSPRPMWRNGNGNGLGMTDACALRLSVPGDPRSPGVPHIVQHRLSVSPARGRGARARGASAVSTAQPPTHRPACCLHHHVSFGTGPAPDLWPYCGTPPIENTASAIALSHPRPPSAPHLSMSSPPLGTVRKVEPLVNRASPLHELLPFGTVRKVEPLIGPRAGLDAVERVDRPLEQRKEADRVDRAVAVARDDAVVGVEWRAVVRQMVLARDDGAHGLQGLGER